MVKKPELVCPAGDWKSLITAVDSGADSVYFGIKGTNMRARANNFDILELPKVMNHLHSNGKKGYLTLNIIIMNHQLDRVKKILLKAKDTGVDAIILWDMAVMSMARQSGLKVHLSTQASVANSEAFKFYSGLGVNRIVLARECTLAQTKDIISQIEASGLNCEIETFVHGAMCVSVSGRCFLSSYSFGKSANKGECQQPCRREFMIKDVDEGKEYIIGQDYLISPKDLCTIEFIDQLIEAGVHSFKIEGRMRSVEYIKEVVGAYRQAIDAYFKKELTNSLKVRLKDRLYRVYNRGFSSGFYFGPPEDWTSSQFQKSYEKVFIGEVTNFYNRISVAEVIIRSGQLRKGDRILFIGKHTPASYADALELQQQHQYVEEVHKGESVGIKLPFKVRRNDQVFLWRPIQK